MFRISRRLDYGLQLMIALSKEDPTRAQATAVLAERLHIPLPFLHQIGRALIQGGLIKATPGPRGGLRMNVAASDISLLSIIETLEGPVRITPEQNGNGATSRVVWEELQRALTAYLGSVTLADLVDGDFSFQKVAPAMYSALESVN
ncbi:MAG: Rrf2 family transcriptional regulator [Anaerolineae bacterium]|nr:Rrf2 family transcriptional regulator [Anaerolineae bacterium]